MHLTAHIFKIAASVICHRHNFWHTSMRCCSEHVCWLHCHQLFYAKWRQAPSERLVLFVKNLLCQAFLLTDLWLQCKHSWRIDCTNIILSVKNVCCKMILRRCHQWHVEWWLHSAQPIGACQVFNKQAQSFLLLWQTVDGFYLLVFQCCRFYSATWSVTQTRQFAEFP